MIHKQTRRLVSEVEAASAWREWNEWREWRYSMPRGPMAPPGYVLRTYRGVPPGGAAARPLCSTTHLAEAIWAAGDGRFNAEAEEKKERQKAAALMRSLES